MVYWFIPDSVGGNGRDKRLEGEEERGRGGNKGRN